MGGNHSGCPGEVWKDVMIKHCGENPDVSAGGWRKGVISQERTKGVFLGVVTFKLGRCPAEMAVRHIPYTGSTRSRGG